MWVGVNPLDYLMGYILGDGSFRVVAGRQYVVLYGNETDLPQVVSALKAIGYLPKVLWNTGKRLTPVWKICLTVKSYHLFLARQMNLGYPKRLPKIIEDPGSLLSGLWDSDGTVWVDRGYVRVEFSSNDLGLLRQVSDLLNKLGVAHGLGAKIVKVHQKGMLRFMELVELMQRKDQLLRMWVGATKAENVGASNRS